ncbi:MAG: MFS transporter [Chloroflexota bacterium]
MLAKFRTIYREFPTRFWIVVGVSFIDGIGATLLYPFFALYITQKFNVGMTVAGAMLAMNSVAGLIGSTIGGALTDKFGRRGIILFGLVFSALSALALGAVTKLEVFYGLIVVVGLLGHVAGPAHNAMIADILPEEKRPEGFGILRVVGNLAWIIGPTIAGFMASRSFFSLFVLDAVLSLITAVVFYRLIPETKPQPREATERESFLRTLSGYRHVLRDRAFMAFIFACILMLTVYQQMYNTLSVFLRDEHGVDPSGYGFLMSSSAILVVLAQFSVTRYIKRFPPLLLMVTASGFYLVGFTMYGFVSVYPLFLLAIWIITTGEMVGIPTTQSLMAAFAPEEMRGRYMAIGGLGWAVPSMVGPWAAGLILDNYNPNWVWYAGGILCAVAMVAFYGLHLKLGARERFRPVPETVPS